MTNSFKATVPLGRLVPSPGNPRQDFGDIAQLAQSLLATGGQPLSPPVVVSDGDRYRIVDGERRWRAMREIHGEDDPIDVLVYLDAGEAEQAVAMLATDDKRRLTPEEQARGFQTMMALGIDDEVAARALGREPEQVRRARRSLAAAEGATQATLDAMIVAGSDDFDDEERARILSAGTHDRWETPETVAASIVRDRRRRKRLEDVRAAIVREPGGGDVEFVDEGVAYAPYGSDSPSGEGRLSYVGEAANAKAAAALMTVTLPDLGVSPADCVAYVTHSPGHAAWVLYRRVPEGAEEGPSKEELEAEERRRERDRHGDPRDTCEDYERKDMDMRIMESVEGLRNAADEIAEAACPCGAAPDYQAVRRRVAELAGAIVVEHAELMHKAVCKAHADGERSAISQARSSSEDYRRGYGAAMDELADMRGFCERLEAGVEGLEDVELFGVAYRALPVDSDGEPLRPGDEVEVSFWPGVPCVVRSISADAAQWCLNIIQRDSELEPPVGEAHVPWPRNLGGTTVRRRPEPTVEDLLREFADEVRRCTDTEDALADYAARLRLAGDDE